MEIRISTNQILKILYILSWILFIGICIEAGSFIWNAFFTLVINPDNASYLDLSSLYNYDPGNYFVQFLLMIIVAVMRSFLLYLIVKILHDEKLNLSLPFNKELGRFIFKVSYLALAIGIFSYWGVKYSEWLADQGVNMPDIQHLRLAGADVWLFMGVILFVIGHIFKRGIEIQIENELTI